MAVKIAAPASCTRAKIAACASSLLGIAFRLHGRSAHVGFDCVGLVAACLASTGRVFDVPSRYRLRGEYDDAVRAFFDDARFAPVQENAWQAGDIILVRIAPRQLHFAIITEQGAVHAHMGLGRVVLTPLPLPWGTVGHWRFQGG